jgi:tetratricopeptide (TPR) repeat protein
MKTKHIISLLAACIVCIHLSYAQVTIEAQTLYNHGLKLKDERKVAEALEKFKQAISINPNYTDALYQAGRCQNELKNYYSAIDYLRKAREVWSVIPKVYFELGYAFEKSGSLDSAIKCYNRCLDLKPDHAAASRQLGYIEFGQEDYANALAHFNKYESALKSEIPDYLYWFRKGYMQNVLKDYNNAKTSLQKSLTYKDNYINTFLELGFAATKLNQDEEAIGYFKKAIDIDSTVHTSYNGIAEVYRDNKKDREQAMTWYRKTLAMNPSEKKANFGMGYCYNSLKKYFQAIDHLKKAIESDPTYTAAYVELGYSYFKLGKDPDAIAQFDKAISQNPKNENARYYACLLHIRVKNKALAQKVLNELKALSSKYVAELEPEVNAL